MARGASGLQSGVAMSGVEVNRVRAESADSLRGHGFKVAEFSGTYGAEEE